MELYNKIMVKFWLFASVLIFIVVTFMGFKDGWAVWVYYYSASAMALMMFFFKRWMMKRMAKHIEFMEKKKAEENS